MPRQVDHSIPETPLSPFPITTEFCDVVAGFGRGSSELGIPTANVPIEQLPDTIKDLKLGVYFGFVRLRPNTTTHAAKSATGPAAVRDVDYNYGSYLTTEQLQPLPVVLSIGLNPFYHNKSKTVELHILTKFQHDFYGAQVKFSILGFIRPELDYTTKEALIKDIQIDIQIAEANLARMSYSKYVDELS
ncbi:LAMI_0B05072g1_1 [Lachancea mirantina]|uniref:Riboflavin kinase n=1 Tax=Lachancea mirantina TaxID=1230905 RepID=A0A1G4IVZ4_9SACH|nr:LAMI_0B05072g1_1 [Lachancea mirantina]